MSREKATPLPDESMLPTPSQRKEITFNFDTAAFDFRTIILDMFRARIPAASLALPAAAAGTTQTTQQGSTAGKPGAGPADADADGFLLSNLHRTALAESRTACRGGRHGGGAAFLSHYATIVRTSNSPATEALRLRFHATLLRFVREVAAPLLGCAAGEVAFQRAPTLRVSFPAPTAMGHAHCDAEYARARSRSRSLARD